MSKKDSGDHPVLAALLGLVVFLVVAYLYFAEGLLSSLWGG